MIEILNEKTIKTNNVEITFEWNIKNAIMFDNKIIVLYEIDGINKYDNIYCYDNGGKLLWRIDSKLPINSGCRKDPFVGIINDNNELHAIDFGGSNFLVDINNGKLISSRFVK